MPLSDVQIRAAKPLEGKTQKLSDGGGLQLWVTPTGSKLWNIAYRFGGKQRKLSLGLYPTISLKAARESRETIKQLLASGTDPGQHKKQVAVEKANTAAMTFDLIATALVEKKRREAKAGRTLTKAQWLLKMASPTLGNRPISEITAPEILKVLQVAETRGKLETAKRLRETIGQVFRYAMATGRAPADPTTALRGAIAAPVTKHRAAIIEPKAFGGLLRAISTYEGAPETRLALELLALTFVRPGELRAAEWSEFDLEAATWSIPASKMKMRRPHKVPLSAAALKILTQLKAITGQGRLLFPSIRTPLKPISENTLNAALRRMGFEQDEMCSHGFRSAASSILNESGLWNADAIERQLAHVDNDSVRRSYARADIGTSA